MGDITLQIDGRSYPVACDDGQEDRVFHLGGYVDQRIKEVSDAAAGSKSQAMMLTSLLLADEVFDLKEQMNSFAQANAQLQSQLQQQAQAFQQSQVAAPSPIEPQVIAYEGLDPADEQEIASLISRMTDRVEKLRFRVQSRAA